MSYQEYGVQKNGLKRSFVSDNDHHRAKHRRLNSLSDNDYNGSVVQNGPVLMCRSDGINRSTVSMDILLLVRESAIDQAMKKVQKVLILGTKYLAFIEFNNPQVCREVLNGLLRRMVYLNSEIVNFEYSTHKELEGPNVERINNDAYNEDLMGDPHMSMHRQPHPSPGMGMGSDIPLEVIDEARALGIRLENIVMVPAVKTSSGFIFFDEYVDKMKRGNNYSMAHHPQPRIEHGRLSEGYNDYSSMGGFDSVRSQSQYNGGNRVVMLTGLSLEFNCDSIFTLCANFGQVERVKISFTKRDNAFVQMASETDAENVINNVDQLTVFDKVISAQMSKMTEVRGSAQKKNSDGETLTKDYKHSDDNRFTPRKKPPKINRPGEILHLANISKTLVQEQGEEQVCEQIIQTLKAETAVFVPGSQTQCFLKFPSIPLSVECLIQYHLKNFHGRKFCISFSSRNKMPVNYKNN